MSAVMDPHEPSAKYASTLQPPLVQHFELMATAPSGVARLRELILTLAVQGKLVPQDPIDEPASELLKKIRTEKDQLTSKGKIKREKFLAEIEDEEIPFGLPVGWEWVRLPSIYYSISPSGSKLLSSAVLAEGKYPVVDQGQRPIAGFTNEASLLIEIPGPVIVFGDHTKEIKYVDFNFVAGADGTKILRPIRQDERFFAWQLRSFRLDDRGYARHFKVLNSSLFALPPLAEQARIVTRVEELMRLCDALEAKGQLEAAQHAQLVQTLLGALTASATPDELADNWQRVATHFDLLLDRPEAIDALEQTILQLAVRGLLVPQDPKDEPASELLKKIRAEKDRLIAEGAVRKDKPPLPIAADEVPYELPPGWEWARWTTVAMKIGDIDHKMPSEVKEGIPYVSPRDFYGKNEIDFDGAKKISESDFLELSSKIRPERGDLIYPRYGTIGVVRRVNVEREFLASYSCAVIKVLHGCVEPDYQYLFSVSGCAKEQAATATNKTTQPNVGLKSIQDFLFPLPPLGEQSRIVARVESMRRLCADLRQRLATRQTTQAYLAEALIAEVA